ncbi:hypothetical protein ASE85_02525 [Sphingobium sp. Leaf26]|uniref:hypothetical protein n=1 Tax=Sphingobium sp. Leaf26 TaxID=1735693 RepID=UPI0007012CD9|nr:hypothetical protein [Sphingobium sp. Leaf26]KQN09829.1 hypothetical protein ASE85_02525 [Sphingobium sp. Leaf26]
MRQPIFNAIKAARGGASFTDAEVGRVDALLDSLSVPPNGKRLTKPEAFWAGLRKVTGALDATQVDIVDRLLAAAGDWRTGWMAYALATAWHEARLKPIEEWGKGKGKAYGAVNSTGKAPYGRGLVQLTWHNNYQRADDELELGGKLAADYDIALYPDIAVKIMVRGMAKGWFTGKSLGTYMGGETGTKAQFVQSRRIINGTDKADLIAGYALTIQDALVAGGWK